jgi:rhomboid family GlyGly-CTERM serine protease
LFVASLSLLATFALQDLPWLRCTLDDLQRGELWRLLTGSLVHADAEHAARDLLPLLFVGALYEHALGARFVTTLLLATAASPIAAFVFDPGLTAYYGLSGTVHGIWTAALLFEWRRTHGRPGAIIVLVSIALVLKLVIEAVSGTPLFPIAYPLGVRSVPMCHLAGALCGVLIHCSRSAMTWVLKMSYSTS